MMEFDGRLAFYKAKADRIGGKVIIKNGDVEYVYPTTDEVVKILKRKLKDDYDQDQNKKGEVITFSKKYGQSPYIQYENGEVYYHRLY